MPKIDFDELDTEYEDMPSRTPIRGNTKPQGSLTDNLRLVKPNRDGAYKRVRQLKYGYEE
jgi:hypothetical protein